MNGRPNHRLAAFALLSLLPVPLACSPDPREISVILITIDTTRADRLGCYGDQQAETPHIDALARSGLLFENAEAVTPITLPSHVSILSGTYPTHHGVRDNGRFRVGEDTVLLSEMLRHEGLSTAAFVSAFPVSRRFGLDRGFDLYDDSFLPESRSGDPLLDWALDPSHLERSAQATTDAALAWIEGLNAKRFFAWIHYYDPHTPYAPPSPFADRFEERLYDGEIAYVDAQIGRLLRRIEELGRDEKTLVVITADHGESLGEHGEAEHSIFVYESTMAIPLIFALKGRVPAGQRRKVVASQVDIVPTVLEILDLPHPPTVHGRSLLQPDLSSRPVYLETLAPEIRFGWSALRAVRLGRLKYIEAPTPELYDLGRDANEQSNACRDEQRSAAELESTLRSLLATITPSGGGQASEASMGPEEQRALEALGYLGSAVDRGTASGADPKDRIRPFNMRQKAQHMVMTGRHRRALDLLEEAMDLWPDDDETRALAGLCSYLLQRYDDAVARYREALELAPDRSALHAHLAEALAKDGQHDASLKVARERLLEVPADLEVFLQFARQHVKDGDSETAAALLGGIVSARADEEKLVEELVRALRAAGLIERAERDLLELVEEHPNHKTARIQLAEVLEARNRSEAAIQQWRELAQRFPDLAGMAEVRIERLRQR